MKDVRYRWVVPAIMALLVALLAGCASPTPTPVPAQPTEAPTQAPAAQEPTAATEAQEPAEATEAFLTINGQAVSEDDLKALPELEVKATNSNGEEDTYQGYSVLALLDKLGISGETLTLVADDGYTAEVPIADLNDECILRIRSKGGLSSTMPGLSKAANVKGVVELKVTGEAQASEPAQELILATTTSTENSGLLAKILPDFESKSGAAVSVVAVGTGQALALGMDGNADVLLVHARAREDAFMDEGHGSRREDVMYNDFVIVGPSDDPAGIAGMKKAPNALAKLAEAEGAFVSRGDDSGTHTKEKAIWAEAGVEPAGDWYVSAGQGMGAVLTMADEQQAYTLSDRATYLARTLEGIDLEILVEGDPILFNPYGVMAVNPYKGDHIQVDLANQFIDWLISVETQELIGDFGVDAFGAPLFTPDSQPFRDVQNGSAAVVTVAGKAFSLADLEAIGLETKTVETPKGEKKEYTGVSIQTLFQMNGSPHEAIVLTASDGYSAEVKTADMHLDCMLALNDMGGVDAVMPGMDGGAWVRDVVDIKAAGQATEGRDPEMAAVDAVLTVAGKAFSQADLEALGVVTQEVEKEGETKEYTGVSLKALLAEAGCSADAITLTASDGYAAEVQVAEINDDCMLSFRNKGGVSAVMPGLSGGAWVKDVVEIAPVVAEAPAAEAVVTVANMPFSQEALEALGVVTQEVENKGETKEYTGVSLLSALSAAGVTDGSIVMTADDGYAAEVAVADITDECMLSFRSKGGVSTVMPGLSGATWVKGVVDITKVAADGPVSVTDALGRTIDLDTIPSRIVVPGKGGWMVGHPLYLFPDARGRVAAMEARRGSVSNFLDCVVEGFSDLQHLEMNSGPEAIVPLEPDCIMMKSYMKKSLGDPLESLGLPVIYLDLETPSKFYEDMQTVGQLFNNPDRADEIVSYYQGKVSDIESAVEGLDKPKVLVIQYNNMAEDQGMTVPPMDWMQTIIVETAGGEPVWGEAAQGGGNASVNFEQIAAWDPDVIFLIVFRSDPEPVMAELKADPKWQALTAVQNEQFYAFPADHYGWDVPDPRWIMGATWASKTLHPEAFADVDMMDEVYEFYGEMYGMDAGAVDECIVPYLTGDYQ